MTPSAFSQDFDDLLAALIEAKVEFVVVGAHALAIHGHVRATGDLASGRTKDLADLEVMEALLSSHTPD